MIIWRTITGGHDVADVSFRATPIVRLHAYPTRWEIELVGGRIDGPANSIGHAKRAALEALAKLLADLDLAVQTALRST
jgi:hypothetical protein